MPCEDWGTISCPYPHQSGSVFSSFAAASSLLLYFFSSPATNTQSVAALHSLSYHESPFLISLIHKCLFSASSPLNPLSFCSALSSSCVILCSYNFILLGHAVGKITSCYWSNHGIAVLLKTCCGYNQQLLLIKSWPCCCVTQDMMCLQSTAVTHQTMALLSLPKVCCSYNLHCLFSSCHLVQPNPWGKLTITIK